MRYSNITLKVLAAKECGIIKSNAQFWKEFDKKEKLEEAISKSSSFDSVLMHYQNELDLSDSEGGIISVYDDEFPVINKMVRINSEKPFLLFYKGNLDLLSDLNKNVAVIGLIDPDEKIIKRETEVVNKLVKNDMIIVSGLAQGCDSVAHEACLAMGGKTIAILPTQISKIYPAKNKKLANEIVERNGLLISEYHKEPKTKFEAVNRFIQRDRLQSMFAKAIILTASYRKGEGDSGSRHAMEAGGKYGIERYAIYNDSLDSNNKKFGLNKDLLLDRSGNSVGILRSSSISEITNLKNPNLISDECESEQLRLI